MLLLVVEVVSAVVLVVIGAIISITAAPATGK